MLIISRKEGESFTIQCHGEFIEVSVLKSTCGRLKIGIEAPKSVKVLRREVLNREMAAELEAAANAENATKQGVS